MKKVLPEYCVLVGIVENGDAGIFIMKEYSIKAPNKKEALRKAKKLFLKDVEFTVESVPAS